jgi:hypothetical protein
MVPVHTVPIVVRPAISLDAVTWTKPGILLHRTIDAVCQTVAEKKNGALSDQRWALVGKGAV